MKINTPCRRFRLRVVALGTGTIAPSDAHTVRQHIAVCPRCSAFYDAIREEDKKLWQTMLSAGDRYKTSMNKNIESPPPVMAPVSIPHFIKYKRLISRLAASILILITIAWAMSHFADNTPSSAAYANVLQPFIDARCVSFTIEITPPGYPREVYQGGYIAPGKIYLAHANGNVAFLHNPQKYLTCKLILNKKLAYVASEENSNLSGNSDDYSNRFLDIIRQLHLAGLEGEHTIEYIGNRDINGTPCQGMLLKETSPQMLIWRAVKSYKPLRIDYNIAIPGKGMMTVIISHINFDANEEIYGPKMTIPDDFQAIPIK